MKRPTAVVPPPTMPGAYGEKGVHAVLRWPLTLLAAAGLPTWKVLAQKRRATYAGRPPPCEPDGPEVVMTGTVFRGDARTYLVLPFEVRPETARLEIEYEHQPLRPALPPTPLTKTVLDLGLWDEKGYRSPEGFRGWSGSRHRCVVLDASVATRCYRPGPIDPGIWYVELGLAAVGPTGARWTVRARAHRGPQTIPPKPDPVDPHYVARRGRRWYHGDFHMHSWHSNPQGPTGEEFIEFARHARLDFLPVTEYVVNVHWNQYGGLQRRHGDVLIWPGREIVTYFGHMQSIGETPEFIEYRHGFEGVRALDIQQAVRDAGALFQVNHPTTAAGRFFSSACRGCAFELGDEIEWSHVDAVEILNKSAVVKPKKLSYRFLEFEDPFLSSSIAFWEALLNAGYPITAVSGSDFKKGRGLGSCATAVLADELSRRGVIEAVRAGCAYLRTRGVLGSPELGMSGTTSDGQDVNFGARLVVTRDVPVTCHVTVRRGAGQRLCIIRNSHRVAEVGIVGDDFEHTFDATRAEEEGPLGTWYRVETVDKRWRTTIGNPIFLGDAEPSPPRRPDLRLKGLVWRNIAAALSRPALPPGFPDP